MADRVAGPIPPRAVESPSERGPVSLTINGSAITLDVPNDRTLLDVLRTDLGLTGTKSGCEIGVCGACSVLVDGRLESACLLLVGLLSGRAVETIEGLGTPADPSALQVAFVEAGGFQCGICTPGQVVAATALLREVADPSEATIRTWMAGNLCRCTGYVTIVEAIRRAARAPISTDDE
ncbi:MAG TPA: (2Fe-2S)-binding protein [Candidatus Limnocylindrales bacterium]|nr:(2Fe-2S)-binding protein [Candidatus Limnocylindrales bacterium]